MGHWEFIFNASRWRLELIKYERINMGTNRRQYFWGRDYEPSQYVERPLIPETIQAAALSHFLGSVTVQE